MRATALDLATVTGLAFGEPPAAPSFLTIDIRKLVGRGARGGALMQALLAHFDSYRPEIVFIEAPLEAHIAGKMGHTQDTTIALNGYVMLAETAAHSRGIPSELLRAQEARKHFVGQPRFKNLNDGKKAVFARCKQLGWDPPNLDCSDAAAIFDLGCSRHSPGFARMTVARPLRAPTLPGAPPKATRRRRSRQASLI